jgi:hypothetical protein
VAIATRADLQDLRAQQGLGLDRRFGALAEFDVVVDLEGDKNTGTVEVDPFHLTHPKP